MSRDTGAPGPSRLGIADLLRVGAAGLGGRPLRTALSALGIAIGIAAMVAVVGIASSGRVQLDRELDRLGTDLLRVAPGADLFGEATALPAAAPAMIARIGPVTDVAATGSVEAKVYRSDLIAPEASGGIAVLTAGPELLPTVGAELAAGAWLNDATAQLPAVVLGATAARQLGVHRVGVQVLVGDEWFTVTGLLSPVPLAEELDLAALVGAPVAARLLGFDGHPTTVYTRSDDAAVESVRAVLAVTANPAAPNEVAVSRPSDALAAKGAVDQAFTGLLVGLSAIALLVGGVGVANTMVISVLERRGEIGLRRALGATRGHILAQFLVESTLLSVAGGAGGVLLGVAATALAAAARGWPVFVPVWASLGGLVATALVGAAAGLYPAARAARLSPTDALAAA
ncbi:ABC transporter permease [Agromyces sp. G08B096]|uniref:ABC transporter permease n=1 Tax=Agromyces sp. G08B096 TaxID=3156399 RepID=A0AAU7W8U6_9MICO